MIKGLLDRDRASTARLISKIENRDSDVPQLVGELFPYSGKAKIIGITGPPGSGKSTLIDGLIAQYRAEGQRVAVIAIDPSSPFTGGAILGDRIRMQQHSGDAGVYIRSLGTRGRHGGLSLATKEVVLALDAGGFDSVLVETAGVGQTELGILRLAQTIVVVLVPESGDSIQVMKAGIMEIADLFAVNKSDRPEADKLVKELVQMAELSEHQTTSKMWRPPVYKTEATSKKGILELSQSIREHQDFLRASGKDKIKEQAFLEEEVLDIVEEQTLAQARAYLVSPKGQQQVQKILARQQDPYTFALEIASSFQTKLV